MNTPIMRCLIAIAAFAWPVALAAQLQVRSGSRVRVTAPTIWTEPHVGSVSAIRGDTIVLKLDNIMGDDRAVALESIERLQLSVGKEDHTAVGTAIGLGVGAVGGLLASRGVEDTCTGELFEFGCTPGEKRGFRVVVLGLLGGLFGAGIGNAMSSDRWWEVPLHRIHLSFLPLGGGRRLALSASISF